MARNPQKIMRLMTILTIVIGFAALAVGIVAIAKEEYIMSTTDYGREEVKNRHFRRLV